MRIEDYWNELKNIIKKDKKDWERVKLLLSLLNNIDELGANCDGYNTIDEGIKGQSDFEEWKHSLLERPPFDMMNVLDIRVIKGG